MNDEALKRLARLLRVREHRRQARERDRAERRRSRADAEAALARQQATLQGAVDLLAHETRQVQRAAEARAPTGSEIEGLHGHLARQRAVIATERAAVAAGATVCNVLRGDEARAEQALRAALNSHRKAEAMHEDRSSLRRRLDRIAAELAEDEQNSLRAAAMRAARP